MVLVQVFNSICSQRTEKEEGCYFFLHPGSFSPFMYCTPKGQSKYPCGGLQNSCFDSPGVKLVSVAHFVAPQRPGYSQHREELPRWGSSWSLSKIPGEPSQGAKLLSNQFQFVLQTNPKYPNHFGFCSTLDVKYLGTLWLTGTASLSIYRISSQKKAYQGRDIPLLGTFLDSQFPGVHDCKSSTALSHIKTLAILAC